MAELRYKTRGASNPGGKPRVYFCCHPEDFGRYFQIISDEILEKQNCTIWYRKEWNGEEDPQFWEDLKQMQLFVMPVTTNLLCSTNCALDLEFPFAVENHIPVLPLMQESGLEAIFNHRCGDLQFLDRNDTDVTAVSYEEKLENFLSSVLIGDELAAKIRAAFDAYVFLSYRKKDRKYAQELMRLIHKNDFCRDIAIWYDEFLTPGENFNDSIEEALRKSDLFVMAVTPNLVNEMNYVMTTEYPMALREGKEILPAELVATDKTLLSQKYQQIPACTDAHHDAALTQALRIAVGKLAVTENDHTPEHNFFIGLAYLGGVDVEVDHERAVELISSAAEAGLPEAAGKLVEMYSTGLGVPRSYETAVMWQEKKVTLLDARNKKEPSEDNLDALFWAIMECGDQYKALGRLSKAKAKFRQGLCRITASALCKTHPRITRNLSIGYEKLGDICLAEGDPAEAKTYYEKELGIITELGEKIGDAARRHDWLVSYANLGDTCMAEGGLSEAKRWYEKAYAIAATLAEETGEPRRKMDLAAVAYRLGILHKKEGNFSQAKLYYEKGIAVSAGLAEETGTAAAKRALSIGWESLGSICLSEGNTSEAKKYYEKSLNSCISLAEEMKTLEAREDLAICYDKLGDLCRAEGNVGEAKAYFEKAFSINLALAEETGMVRARRNLAVSYERQGDICKAEGNLADAKAHYEKSFSVRTALAGETGTVEDRRSLAVACEKLGSICCEEGDRVSAKAYLEQDNLLSRALAEETGMAEDRRGLAACYTTLGKLCKQESDWAGAKVHYEAALAICEALAQETHHALEFERDLFPIYTSLGDVCRQEGDFAGAKAFYQKSLTVGEILIEKMGTTEASQDAAAIYEKLGDLCCDAEELTEAKIYYEKSLAIRTTLAKKLDTLDCWEDMAYVCQMLATATVNRQLLERSISVYQMLARRCPEEGRYQRNAEALQDLRQYF